VIKVLQDCKDLLVRLDLLDQLGSKVWITVRKYWLEIILKMYKTGPKGPRGEEGKKGKFRGKV